MKREDGDRVEEWMSLFGAVARLRRYNCSWKWFPRAYLSFYFYLFLFYVTAGAKSGVMLLFPAFPEPKCRGKNRWKKREEKDIDERVYLGDINHLSVSSGNSIISVTSLIHHWLGGQAWHYDLKESGLFPNPSLPTSFTSSLCLGNSIFLCSHPFPGE